MNAIQTIVDAGSKVWQDSVDPDLLDKFIPAGITGATSNPKIISDLIDSGRFDAKLTELLEAHDDDYEVAWGLTDFLVKDAQSKLRHVWQQTAGNDGWVSFELDPILEDPEQGPSHEERVRNYIDLARRWSEGEENRMIKVPATPAGLDALEEVAAAGVTINTTLIFTSQQYQRARDAVWRGRQRYGDFEGFKSVYSIFISRIDVYTQKHAQDLSDEAQGRVGLVNAKRLWLDNRDFWAEKGLKLDQEIIFASTGTKRDSDPPDKYVEAVTGSGIQTNPPEVNEWIAESGKTYVSRVAEMPEDRVLKEIDAKVDSDHLYDTLMAEGVVKFADPQKDLMTLIGRKRETLVGS